MLFAIYTALSIVEGQTRGVAMPRLGVVFAIFGCMLALVAVACDDGGGGAAAPAGGGDGETYTLTVGVAGGSHVRFNTPDGVEHTCPGDCSAEFALGTVAEVRRGALDEEEEKAWRLSKWGGDCAQVNAEEVGGGRCPLTMTEDHSATVQFEPRPEVRFVQTGSNVDVAYQLEYEPVKQLGGNPAAARGTIGCHLPGCADTEVIGHYDLGTQITVTIPDAQLKRFVGFDGACAGTENPCRFEVKADTVLNIAWAQN